MRHFPSLSLRHLSCVLVLAALTACGGPSGGPTNALIGDGPTLAMPDLVGDLNANGLPDTDDIVSGFSDDDNGNGIVDEVEADCDNNGTLDGRINQGSVFDDADFDGERDAGEAGIAGITVELYDRDGNVVANTTTDANGDWSVANQATFWGLRIEFSGWAPPLLPSIVGIDNGSSIQTVIGSNCNTSFALHTPAICDFSDGKGRLATPCYLGGDASGSTEPAIVSFDVTAEGIPAQYGGTGQNPSNDASYANVGSVWGLAYEPGTKRLFASALLKRHTNLGPQGMGGIYVIDYSGASPVISSSFSLQGFLPANGGAAINLGSVTRTATGDNALVALPALGIDIDAFPKVAKNGYGDIDFAENNTALWLVNLNQQALIRIDLSVPSNIPPTPASVQQFPLAGIPGLPTCTNGVFRPWALKFQGGAGYLGGVCSAESPGGTSANLQAHVLRFNPTNIGAGFTSVLSFPLNYPREAAAEPGTPGLFPGNWMPWTDSWSAITLNGSGGPGITVGTWPQPILSDIEFDDNGNMILGFSDRFGHQQGDLHLEPTSGATEIIGVFAAGDTIHACFNAGTGAFALEGTPLCPVSDPDGFGGASGTPATPVGEFYFDDSLTPSHLEVSTGGLANLPGLGEIATTAYDPVSQVFSSGIHWYSTTTGGVTQQYQITDGGVAQRENNFGKGIGLGDLELLCAAPPLEIGNCVFVDANETGLQEPADPPLAGVTVELWLSGAQVATTTTDALGKYVFNGDNVTGGLIENNANYEVRIDLAGAALAGYSPAVANAPGSDLIDSDGDATIAAGYVTAPVTPLLRSEANHSYDFGFVSDATIGDLVWNDTNSNGTQDPGESGIPNVVLTLCAPGTDGICETPDDIEIATQFTDANGAYDFTNVLPGTYCVKVDDNTIPPGLIHSTGNDPATIVITPGLDYNAADFGYAPPASIGDRVYRDDNGNALQDGGEPALPGIDVVLSTSGPDNVCGTADDVEIARVTTDANGDYLFDGLASSDYCVSIDASTLPAGLVLTTANDPTQVFLAPNEARDNVDFGYRYTGQIGDVVFEDLDGNGTQDPGENGIPGVDVILCTPGPDATCDTADDVVLQTVTTDGGGAYAFTFLGPDTYCVKISDPTVPGGHVLTTGNDPVSVPLGPSEIISTVDFGYQPVGSIGDTVFEDADGNGTQGPGEPGIPGVTVSLVDPGPDGLCDTADDVGVNTTTTDANGMYVFTGLGPASYCVSVDTSTLPESTMLNTTTNDPTLVNLAGLENRDDVDFGYQYTGSIGDTVWDDINLDGTLDGGDAPLPGIDVRLLAPGPDGVCGTVDDVLLDTQTTDAGGNYLFEFLAGATYCVDVDDNTVPPGYVLTTVNDPATIILPANTSDLTADFGYGQQGSLGDTVFLDVNGNGTQDAGDNGIPGVTINLLSAGPDGICGTPDDVAVTSTTTDANGVYGFTSLGADTYCVDVDETTLPPGLSITTGPEPATATLTPGQVRQDVDIGYENTGSIGDLIWDDLNGDGVRDPGEPGLGGVDVRLCFAGPDTICGTADDVVIETQTTDAAGAYLFENLGSGSYCVKVIDTSLPAGYAPTTTPSNIQNPTLAPGQTLDTVDFGYAQIGSIGNFVWEDRNDDTVQDATEPGLAGVDVELITAGPNGTFGDADDIVQDTQTTDANGGYLFPNLLPGDYRVNIVEATLPPSMMLTTANEPLDYTLAANEAYLDADFGYRHTGSIGDFVWNDLNGDGVQDAGEPALGGVTLTLIEAGADGTLGTADDVAFGNQTTDAAGTYDFVNLPAGLYNVTVDTNTVPAGFTLTTPPNPASVTLNAGEDHNDADFGFLEAASIGDTVFIDRNGDGVQDAVDIGIAGVDVMLCTPGPDALCDTTDDVVIETQTTGAAGDYNFIGLAPDTYCVKVDDTTLPPGVELTTSNDPTSVTLSTGETRDDVDFGYRDTGRISDKVFNDRDQDGTVDAGENGWPNVTVELVDAGPDGVCGTADDIAAGTATTDAQGCYEFVNLPGGTYCVTVDETTLPPGLILTTPPGTFTVPLAPGEDNPNIDFGYRSPGSIGDFVFEDTNANGTFDVGETPLPNVTINLIEAGPDGMLGTADDITFPPVTTDANGNYSFPGLTPGFYRVSVDETTVPTDYVNTTANNPLDIMLADGEAYVDADFGYTLQLFSIGDTVFVDSDRDGVYEPEVGEAPIAGVLVRLLDANGNEVAQQTTDADGIYLFQVPRGEYTVLIDDANYQVGGPLEPYDYTGPFPDDQNTETVDSDLRGVNFGFAPLTPPGSIQFCSWWLRNTNSWPLNQILVGDQTLTQAEAIQVLDHGNRLLESTHSIARAGLAATIDMSYVMGWALIGAKLNVGAGNGSAGIEDVIRAGDQWLIGAGGIGSGLTRSDSRYATGLQIFNQLNDFNNGVTSGN